MPRVRAGERAVAILTCFTPAEPWLNLTEVASRTGLDKVTTSHLLATLLDCGLVRQDQVSRAFALTHRIISMSGAVPGHLDLQELVEPVLRDLSARTDCIAFLSTFGRHGAICLARAMIDPPIRVQLWKIGESMPYNQGAAPRLLFANLSDVSRERILSGELPEATLNTIIDADRLRADAESLRGREHVIAMDDIVLGLSAAAHVICNRHGKIMGALSVSGLTPMFTGEGGSKQIAILRRSASELERRLSSAEILLLDFTDDGPMSPN